MTATLTIVQPGPLALIEDLGRPGHAAIGVTRSGAADLGAFRLANRLVGNPESMAALEVTLGGLVLETDAPVLLAVTGADVSPVGASDAALNQVFTLLPGERLRLRTPAAGLRSYVGVRGGIDVEPVLGSRSTDVLAGLGPPRLQPGARLPVGHGSGDVPAVDVAPVARPADGVVVLALTMGPRDDWFTEAAGSLLTSTDWTVTAELDRVGIRLAGPALERARPAELPSEGMPRGAVQVPANGQPIIFGADHPTTGGYPVIGVLTAGAGDLAAQLRPGQHARFRVWRGPVASHI